MFKRFFGLILSSCPALSKTLVFERSTGLLRLVAIAGDAVAGLPEVILGEDRISLAVGQAAVFLGEGGKLLCGHVGGDFGRVGCMGSPRVEELALPKSLKSCNFNSPRLSVDVG
jgi:hypothetical protein